MRNKKYMAIPILLVLALVITGFAYAHWSEWMYIEGEVQTGELCAKIVTWFSNDPGTTIDPGYTKHVATTTCWIYKEDPHYAYILIENAYPSYEVRFTCDIENCGTIPWHMQTPKVNGVTLVDGVYVDFDLDEDGYPDVNIMYIDGEDKQVHPGGFVEWSLRIHVKQTAHQNWTYDFTIEVEVIQWNMA